MTTSAPVAPDLTDAQIAQFECDGGITFDGPFTDAQLEAASELCGQLHAQGALGGYSDYRTEAPFVQIMQHPFLEENAKRILRADQVELWELAVRENGPQPGRPAGPEFEHVDINYTLEQFGSTPRNYCICYMVWLTDVTLDRGPFMFRPGSHRQIANHIVGQKFAETGSHIIGNGIPPLQYADLVPVLCKKGQITLQTSSTIHGRAIHTGHLPRRVMFVSFAAKGFQAEMIQLKPQVRFDWHRQLRDLFDEDRRHVLAV